MNRAARGIVGTRDVLKAVVICGFMALACAPVASAATTSGAVISNGTVQLGINAEGDLNYDCVGASDTGCPDPSAGDGEPIVGLRYVPFNLDSISPGCACEGWGLADAGSGLTGFANQSAGDANITVDSFNAPSATQAISTVTIADATKPGFQMQIVQDYHPSPLSSNLFVDTVTVTNTGTNTLTDLRYRRAMDWDVEPTQFDEWVTIQGTSPQLLFDSDDGFADSDPLAGPSYIDSEEVCGVGYTGTCQFTDLGFGGTYPTVTTADDHGALFDFGLGQLTAGQSRSFNIYYGAANSETAATSALTAGGAQVYSLGESNCTGDTIATCADPAGHAGVEQGKPATFMFGFVTTLGDLSLTKSDSPDPVTVGQNLTYTVHVANNGPQAAAGVQVTDPLPANVNLVSATPTQGSCTGTTTVSCNLGSLALNGSADISIVATPASVGSGTLSNTATVTSASSDANSANNSDTEETQVLPDDSDPPDTIIDSAAHGTTDDSTPSFAFHSTEANSTFECSIDTGTPNFGACSGPGATHTPSALADGTYTFRVRATDQSNNTDQSPATETFTVDTPPDTIIDSAAHGTTNDSTPSFAFHATEANSTFECSIDTGTPNFGACSGPGATHTPSALADGAYTFRVRATDSDGTPDTDSTPATESLTIDTAVPDTIIDSAPHGTTGDSTPTFAFHATEGNSTFECSIDTGTPNFGPCSGPGATHTPSALANGTYTFRVRATDQANNTDPTPATETFTVNVVTTPPNPPPTGGSCAGQTATIVSTGGVTQGTKGADVIAGTSGKDKIIGHGGADVICGAGGKDKLKGNGGDDTLKGGAGDDDLKGGAGDDDLDGGEGKDTCNGGGGKDTVTCEKEKGQGGKGGKKASLYLHVPLGWGR